MEETAAGTPMAPVESSIKSMRMASDRMLSPAKPEAVDGIYRPTLADLANPDEVIRVVLARARYAANYRRAFEDEWHRGFLAMFQVFSTELESGWQSQRYMPLILSNVETAHSIIGASVLDAGKICRYQGKTPEGRDTARAQEELLDAQNKGPVKVGRHIFDSEWWALVTGTAMVDTGWEYERGQKIVAEIVQDASGQTSKVMRQKPAILKDHPFVNDINPLDVYLCPHSTKGKDHEWAVIRARCTMGSVRAAAGKGHIDQKACDEWVAQTAPTDGKPGAQTGFDSVLGPKLLDIWLGQVGKSASVDQPGDAEDSATDDKLVELLIYRSRTEIVTLGTDRHMLGYSRNPHKHGEVGIVTNPFLEIKGCPYGRGLAGILLGHQELINKNVNLFTDVSDVSMMRPMVVDRSLISVLDDEAIFEPNAMLRARMNARDAVIPLEIPAPTNLFLMWDAHIKKDADDAGGFTEQARGIAPTNSPTATEFTGVQTNIQNRLRKHIINTKWYVEDVCSLVAELNEQYMTQEQVVSYIGDDGMAWRTIKPTDLVGEVICQATTSPKYANPDLHVQRQLQIFQVVAQLLMSGQNLPPPVVRMLRSILRAANTEDVDLILPAGMETVKSWRAENEAMYRGYATKPTVAEVRAGQSPIHIQGHAMFLQYLEQDPDVPESVKEVVRQHILDHQTLEQQFGQAAVLAAQGGASAASQAPAGMQPSGSPDRQQATALGQAQGGGGIPGSASPGPAAPMGRPMGMGG